MSVRVRTVDCYDILARVPEIDVPLCPAVGVLRVRRSEIEVVGVVPAHVIAVGGDVGFVEGSRESDGIRNRRFGRGDTTTGDGDGCVQFVHTGGCFPHVRVGEAYGITRVGSDRCVCVRQVEIELVGAVRYVGRYGQLLVDGGDNAVRQPCARIGSELDGVGLVAVLEHDVGVALIIERSVTDVLELEVYRQFGTGCYLVAVGSFNQLVAVTHLTVQLVERAVVAPVIGGCLGVSALDKSPVESAHFGSRLLVRGP